MEFKYYFEIENLSIFNSILIQQGWETPVVHKRCAEKTETVVTTTPNHKTKEQKTAMVSKMTNF